MNKEKQREAQKRYCLRHPDRKRASRKRWKQAHPEKVKAAYRKCVYGITDPEYQNLLKTQEGKCAVCQTPMASPHIDHCHKTKKVRGLLCQSCNHGIGFLKDNIAILKSAIKYLGK
jgi:Recombination endonuclease VII